MRRTRTGLMARARRQNPVQVSLLQSPHSSPLPPHEASCIGCGCRDSHACVHPVTGPCWWIKVDYKLGIGVCSECEHKVEEYEERVNAHYEPARDKLDAELARLGITDIRGGTIEEAEAKA